MTQLNNINVLLGVTGGIAAYKSAELVRALKKQGANVQVVLTRGGREFITPLTLQSLSGNRVHENLFDPQAELSMSHIDLARWADLVLIAPASANTLSKLANGRADNLLTTLCLATHAPLIVAPAMNQQMWQHPATQHSLDTLRARDVQVIGPASGEQACGEVGPGRMSEPDDIVRFLLNQQPPPCLQNVRVMITAGPTQEAIDAVRYITNHSSGKMGYALAEAAAAQGATVTLISGPTALPAPTTVDTIRVTSAQQMQDAIMAKLNEQDIFISAAAVADYTLPNPSPNKLKKTDDTLALELHKTCDILSTIGQMPHKPFLVGFAAETDNLLHNANQKRHHKNLDMIIANDVSASDIGFNSDDNAVTVISQETYTTLGRQPKTQLAKQLIPMIALQYHAR